MDYTITDCPCCEDKAHIVTFNLADVQDLDEGTGAIALTEDEVTSLYLSLKEWVCR